MGCRRVLKVVVAGFEAGCGFSTGFEADLVVGRGGNLKWVWIVVLGMGF